MAGGRPSKQPTGPAGPGAFMAALRDPGRNLKEKYRGKPLELAARLGVMLPRKPTQVMRDMGLWTDELQERWGDEKPGLRELVRETCLLMVESAVAIANRGGGKRLPLTERVPTPDGWKTIGELRVGDVLYDERGEPCRVRRLHPIYKRTDAYEILFNDRSSIVADADHLWLTSTATSRHAERYAGDGRRMFSTVKTTAQIRDTLTIPAGAERRDFHHQIKNSLPIKFPEADLPVDPYLLGLWLGDGSCQGGYITAGSEDVDAIRKIIEDRGHRIRSCSPTNTAWLIVVEGLTAALRGLGVLPDKHVPVQYLRGSVEQREALLQGLMDSDGTTRATSNNCQFDNTNERLSDAVYELVVSLGWKATTSKKIGRLYGVEHKPSHRVSFRPTRPVFLNVRKASRLNFLVNQESRHLSRTIVGVLPAPSVPMRCIEVDSPSNLFLAGDQMVPTHNSKGVSFIEFYLWMILDFDCLNLGGSELQAGQVYEYVVGYIDSDKDWRTQLRGGETMRERTYKDNDAWIRVLTASQKQVRSPHAGGSRKGMVRGGALVIDEEAETEPEIVAAALPTINTAVPSINVRCSTFHNLGGSFQEVVDNHEEMGYKLYIWDIFDVCAGCGCKGGPTDCQSEEVCFREDHFEDFIDPEDGKLKKKLIHKAYCGGRAKYGEGWMLYTEIVKLWKRMKRNHTQWEVEAMGSRPAVAGHVIKDQTSYSGNIIDVPAASLYVPGGAIYIDVDWGTVNAAVTVWQERFISGRLKQVLLHADLVPQAGQTEIFGKILGYAALYKGELVEIACDIGGGGNYNNKSLREEKNMPIRDVNFNEEKEAAVAAFNILSEAGDVVIPAEHEDFITQCRNWRRKNNRIVKENDHLCDAGVVCHFSRFIEMMGLSHIRAAPKSFSTHAAGKKEVSEREGRVQAVRTNVRRKAMARSFGRRGR